jgi:predicted negative regulator of RcsB-dependent stress response
MSRELTRKKLKKDEFVEAAFNVEQWVEDNWRTLLAWVGGVVAIAVVVIAVLWWNSSRREQANSMLADGVLKYREALASGTVTAMDDALPVLERSAGHGGSVGWMGRYYHAAALVHAGRAADAIGELEALTSEAPGAELEQAALALTAKAHLEAGSPEEAMKRLRELADRGQTFAPQALLVLGNLQRTNGREAEAVESYRSLLSSYPEDPHAPLAQQALNELSR